MTGAALLSGRFAGRGIRTGEQGSDVGLAFGRLTTFLPADGGNVDQIGRFFRCRGMIKYPRHHTCARSEDAGGKNGCKNLVGLER